MVWSRGSLSFPLCLALLAPACGDDGGEQGSTTSATDPSGASSGADVTGADGNDDGNCVPGQVDCVCLDEQCVAGAYCVEGVCALGPRIDIDEGRSVVGGVIVPIEADVEADEFSWSQVEGVPVEILGGQTLQIGVSVPADAPPGEPITLRLTATRNGVSLDADVRITVLAASFQNALPDVSDPAQLGSTEGLAFGSTGLWVVSTEGFASLFDGNGAFVQRYDVPGEPVGMAYRDENLFIANREGTGRVELLNTVSGSLSTLFTSPGDANLPLVDGRGDDQFDVYLSTRLGQTVVRYSSESDSTNVFLEDMGVINPNALTFGPEGNTIYVGAQGHVWRVPLTDEGVAGTPEDYLVLGDDSDITYEVDGLVFDEGNNLWIGCPNASTLFVSHYAVAAPAEISRSFTNVGGGVSRFVNLTFGDGDFEGDTLYYTNLGDGTVGRLRVGLQRL